MEIKKENFIPSFTFKIIGALGIKGKENKNPIHLAPFMKSPFAPAPNHSRCEFGKNKSGQPPRTVKINFKPNGTKKVIFSFYFRPPPTQSL